MQQQRSHAATAYLLRDPYVNRELLLALRYEQLAALEIATDADQVTGVLLRGAGPFDHEGTWIRLDADDPAAVDQLVARVQPSPRWIVSAHRPWIADLLTRSYGLEPDGTGIYGYLLDHTTFRAQPSADARLLGGSDRRLVERSDCGWTRPYFERILAEGRRPWAIMRDGAIVCRASSGYPHLDSEEVIGVWTHPRWRQRGFARQLASAIVADILGRTRYAIYTTTYDNLASQAIARGLGFQNCFAATSYRLPSS